MSAMGRSPGVREEDRGRIQGDGVLSPLLPESCTTRTVVQELAGLLRGEEP